MLAPWRNPSGPISRRRPAIKLRGLFRPKAAGRSLCVPPQAARVRGWPSSAANSLEPLLSALAVPRPTALGQIARRRSISDSWLARFGRKEVLDSDATLLLVPVAESRFVHVLAGPSRVGSALLLNYYGSARPDSDQFPPRHTSLQPSKYGCAATVRRRRVHSFSRRPSTLFRRRQSG